MGYFDKVGDRIENIGRSFGGAYQTYMEKKKQLEDEALQKKNLSDLVTQFEGKIAPAEMMNNPFASRGDGPSDYGLGLDLSGSPADSRALEREAIGREVDGLGVLGELAKQNVSEPNPEKTQWPEMDITGLGVYGDKAPKMNLPIKDFNSQIADSIEVGSQNRTEAEPSPYEKQLEISPAKLPSSQDVLLARAFAAKNNPGKGGTDFLDELQKVLDAQEKGRLQKELIGVRGGETLKAIDARGENALGLADYNWGQRGDYQQNQHGMNLERDKINNTERSAQQAAREAGALNRLKFRFENMLKNPSKQNNPEALQASVLSYDAAIADAEDILPSLGDPMISKEAAGYLNMIHSMKKQRQSLEAKLAASRANSGQNPVPQTMEKTAPIAPKRFKIVSVKSS